MHISRLANLGAVLNGAGGTVTFAAPALFSSVWFPAHQRAVATAIITMFNYVGVSGSLLIGKDLRNMQLYATTGPILA